MVIRSRREAVTTTSKDNDNGSGLHFFIDSHGELRAFQGTSASFQLQTKKDGKENEFGRKEINIGNLLKLLNRKKRSFKVLTTITITNPDGTKEKRYVVLHENVRRYLTKAQFMKKPKKAPIFGYWSG